VLAFVFTDKDNKSVALHVRRGIAEFVPVPGQYYRQAARGASTPWYSSRLIRGGGTSTASRPR
jgi:hypothetical protein